LSTKPVAQKQIKLLALFDKAKAVKTPIQLASFMVAGILAVILSRTALEANVLALFVVLLPFVFLSLIFTETTLEWIRQQGTVALVIVSVMMIGALAATSYVVVSIVRFSHESLVSSPHPNFLLPSRKEKIQNIKDARFRLATYSEGHTLISRFYYAAITDCLGAHSRKDSCSTATLLRKELDQLDSKIIGLKQTTLNEIYGSDEIAPLVLKLQDSLLTLDSARYFWDVVFRVYGLKGTTYSVEEIVDTRGWNLSPPEMTQLKDVRFSQIEADLIRALGRDIITKPLNGFGSQDVTTIRKALGSLGYLSDAAGKLSEAEILSRYRNALNDYLTPAEQKQPFYRLAFQGLPAQIQIYVALYDTGLLDLRRFLLKYCPEDAREIMLGLMDKRISLFNLADTNKLTQSMFEHRSNVGGTKEEFSAVIFTIRDDIKAKMGSSADVVDVLSSSTMEEYFIRTLKLMLRKSSSPTDRDLFVKQGYAFLGVGMGGNYPELLQSLLSYYEVVEADLVINSLEG
jgi:hypothetical protein